MYFLGLLGFMRMTVFLRKMKVEFVDHVDFNVKITI